MLVWFRFISVKYKFFVWNNNCFLHFYIFQPVGMWLFSIGFRFRCKHVRMFISLKKNSSFLFGFCLHSICISLKYMDISNIWFHQYSFDYWQPQYSTHEKWSNRSYFTILSSWDYEVKTPKGKKEISFGFFFQSWFALISLSRSHAFLMRFYPAQH